MRASETRSVKLSPVAATFFVLVEATALAKPPPPTPLEQAFDDAASPVYLVATDRTIAYANAALADWLDTPVDRVLGRRVEYHSEPDATGDDPLLPGLCPSPTSLWGERGVGAISTTDDDGRLRRRRAEFSPLAASGSASDADSARGHAVLVVADTRDLDAGELVGAAVTGADELHAALQQLRRGGDAEGPPPSLIGGSDATKLLRRRVDAAAASGANSLVVGQPGTGRGRLARWVFRQRQRQATLEDSTLLPIDAALIPAERLLDTLASAIDPTRAATGGVSLENADTLPAAVQTLVAGSIVETPSVMWVATCASLEKLSEPLRSVIVTVVLPTTRLADRPGDLPMLLQWCVEQTNRGAAQQVSGLSAEAVERLALHPWPGDVPQLQSVIDRAREGSGAVIQAEDLPPIVHQAALAAELGPRGIEAIDLDAFLSGIERDLVVRALDQTDGNKAETARLLGMTRPRLYRRLARLGMLEASETAAPVQDDPAGSPDDPQREGDESEIEFREAPE